jgi:hypothetical protein
VDASCNALRGFGKFWTGNPLFAGDAASIERRNQARASDGIAGFFFAVLVGLIGDAKH